jgi:hypothetical protein
VLEQPLYIVRWQCSRFDCSGSCKRWSFGKTAASTVWAAAISIDSMPAKFVTRQKHGSLPGQTNFSHATSAPFLDACKSSHHEGIKLNRQFWPITALAPHVTAFTFHSVVKRTPNSRIPEEHSAEVPAFQPRPLHSQGHCSFQGRTSFSKISNKTLPTERSAPKVTIVPIPSRRIGLLRK